MVSANFFLTPAAISAGVIGLLTGGILAQLILSSTPPHTHHDLHPIADPYDSEYHVHADFHIVVRDTLVRLDDDSFQTTSEQELHPTLHLHDNNGDTLHIHKEEKTLAEFLASLGIALTDSCLSLDNTYCSGETEEVLLFVNGTLYNKPLTHYIPLDDDSILLYYGAYDMQVIATLIETIPEDACYYSGTCPERGVAPPESCGETCEL